MTYNDTLITSVAAVIHSAGVNDAPVITAPAALTVTEDAAVLVSGILIEDVDAADAADSLMMATVTCSSCTLILGSRGGLRFIEGFVFLLYYNFIVFLLLKAAKFRIFTT